MAYNRTNAPAPQKSNISELKSVLGSDSVKKRFEEVLGKKAAQFTASIVNVVNGNSMLKRCSVQSVVGAAFVAATYDLPIDNNLGFAAIVPYNNRRLNQETGRWESVPEAQFQMMYKGFIQLAIRSGCYKKMNYSVVYEDELLSYNPITGDVEFVQDFSKCKQRNEGNMNNIAGYYAWFELNTGFRHELFMSTAEVTNHAIRYSQSFRKDREENKTASRWSIDFTSMALKTVIKLLLSKWGILSIEMQRAIVDDQQVFDDDGNGSYSDNRPDDAVDPFEQAEQNVIDTQAAEVPQIQAKPEASNPIEQAQHARAVTHVEPVKRQKAEQEAFMDLEKDFPNADDTELPFK